MADLSETNSIEQLAAADEALDQARDKRTLGPLSWFVRQVSIWLRVIRRNAKRVVVAIAGTALMLLGVVMLVLPGPGLAFIIAGLALLATEFVWAEHLLRKAKKHSSNAANTGKGVIKRVLRKQ
jgi:uncharacterized protein (TIGR02611 family)